MANAVEEPSIPLNAGIEIVQVANGFLVTPQRNYRDGAYREDQAYVFQSYAELLIWLGDHFEHRAANLRGD